jgi:hypothetical protein
MNSISRRSRRRTIFSAISVLFAVVVIAVPVMANPPGPGTGNNDPFQPTDFTPDCNPSPTINLNNPTTHAAPVPVTCDPPGSPTQNVTVTWVSDTLSGNATDDAWGQGDKSDCFLAKAGGVNGACVTQVYGIGASKTDLQYHGIGLERGPGGHQYLYSGIKRLQAGGITSSNANYNVEVNQLLPAYQPAAPICPLVAPNTGGCNMWRSPGDLTFMTDWGGNQSSCDVPTPAICAYVWIDFSTGTGKTPSPAGSACFNGSSAPPCWGLLPGGSAKLSDNPDKAAGSINSGAATQPSTFSEIGVDLTESGLVPPGACETFRNVWAHSRSSSSFTAELKDFIFGNVTISTCSTTTTLLHERTSSTGTTDVTPANNGKNITVKTGAWVNDVATVSAGATGNVNFRYYSSLADCNADTTHSGGTNVSTNAVSGGTPNTATSAAVQFSSTGTFYWRAFYLGDGLSPSISDCDETVTVRSDTTTSTVLHQRTNSTGDTDVNPPNNGASITVKTGAWVNDVASVLPSAATGTVSFKYYPSLADCTADTNATAAGSGISLASGSATSDTKQFNSIGTFYWRAFFTGSGLFNDSASVCGDEILTVVQVDTAISTAPWYYPNDKATISAPNGGGNLAGSITFKLYDTSANCATNDGVTGLLYSQAAQTVSGAGPLDFNTSNTSVKVSTSTTVYWNVTFTSTNPSQRGRNSVCVESINATLAGDSSGTVGNTP